MSTRPSWLGGATRAPKPDPCPSLGLFSRGGKKEPQPDFSTNDQTERPILISLRLVADTARHLRNGLLEFCGLRLCQRILLPSDDIVPLCPKGLTLVCLRPPSRLAMPIEMNRCDFTQFSEARSVSQLFRAFVSEPPRFAQTGSHGSVPISAGTETSTSSRSSEVAISWCGNPPGIITLSPTPKRSFRPPANSRSTQPLRM